jgi:hypothetical protein
MAGARETLGVGEGIAALKARHPTRHAARLAALR